MKLHHLLEQEADELKRLLGGRAGAMASQGSGNGVDEAATRAALSRLKTDMASRRLHEASTSASEVCGNKPVMVLLCTTWQTRGNVFREWF